MSSPASTKRKRTAASAMSSTTDLAQPLSRDASGEELAIQGGPSSNTRHHRKTNASVDSTTTPPNKRARTRGNTNGNARNIVANEVAEKDPGEPSSTTEDSADIEAASPDLTNKAVQGEREEGTEGGRTMKDPPKGIVHPRGGYKTNPPPEGRAVRVYADGVFDLFHLGHMRQLEQAKTAFPNTYLIVGVTGDADTHRRKGLTVLSGAERAETIRHCKWVDEVIPSCPWIVTAGFLKEHNIDYVAHDDEPYGADEGDDIYEPIKKEGKFLVTQRTEGVSTTGIITKIVRDYEKYIARQFKRGTSRQELNVSWLKKNELDIKRHVAELRDNIKHNWTSAGGEIGRDLRTFWQSAGVSGLGISRPGSPAPGSTKREGSAKSPATNTHLRHLEIPGISSSTGRAESPSGRTSRSDAFAAGYSLGLVGGIKSWMQKPRSLRGSIATSPENSEEEDAAVRSPTSPTSPTIDVEETPTSARGRKGQRSAVPAPATDDVMDTA